RVVGEDDAPHVVGAEIEPDVIPHSEDRAVAPRGETDLVRLMARVRGAHHMLASTLDPLHGAAEDHRGGRYQEILGVAGGLGPEAAAAGGGEHPGEVWR